MVSVKATYRTDPNYKTLKICKNIRVLPWCMGSPSRVDKWRWHRRSLSGSRRGWRSPCSCDGECWTNIPSWWTAAPRKPETLPVAGWSRCAASDWWSCPSDSWGSDISARCCSPHLNRLLHPTADRGETKGLSVWKSKLHLTQKFFFGFFFLAFSKFNSPVKTLAKAITLKCYSSC